MLIAWSGGCDSTLLLHDLLFRKGDFTQSQDFSQVRTLSLCNPQLAASEVLKRKRDKLQAEFKRRGAEFQRIEIDIASQGGDLGEGWVVPCLWVSLLALYANQSENCFTGWVKGDDALTRQFELAEAFRLQTKVMGRENALLHPFDQIRKPEVILRLKKAGLYGKTFWCECPKGERACGQCHPCRAHKVALLTIEKGLCDPFSETGGLGA